MKRLSGVLLMSEAAGHKTLGLAAQADIDLDAIIVSDSDALERSCANPHNLLLSFGTGVIVAPWILQKPGLLCLNVHAASPQYPGRDPHHFAVYDEAKQYGATMHYMTERVDAGAIVDVELFEVPALVTPKSLLDLANEAGWRLIERLFQRYPENGVPKTLDSITWGERKSTRKMFSELCRIEPTITKEEFGHRYRATAMPGYRNLYVDIHGMRFRIEEAM